MKFKVRLIAAMLLFLPAWYAIVSWSIADADTRNKTSGQMADIYRRAFPVTGFTFTKIILLLLALSIAGLVIILRMPYPTTRTARIFRICIGVLGAVSTAILCFSLMRMNRINCS
jgi:uncharacterized membrane protein